MAVSWILLIYLTPVLSQSMLCFLIFTFNKHVFTVYIVNVYPLEFISIPGGDATFICSHTFTSDTITSVQWLINGMSLEILNLNNVVTDLTNSIGTLNFTDLPLEYNKTRIRCTVEFSSGRSSSATEAALLNLQG